MTGQSIVDVLSTVQDDRLSSGPRDWQGYCAGLRTVTKLRPEVQGAFGPELTQLRRRFSPEVQVRDLIRRPWKAGSLWDRLVPKGQREHRDERNR